MYKTKKVIIFLQEDLPFLSKKLKTIKILELNTEYNHSLKNEKELSFYRKYRTY